MIKWNPPASATASEGFGLVQGHGQCPAAASLGEINSHGFNIHGFEVFGHRLDGGFGDGNHGPILLKSWKIPEFQDSPVLGSQPICPPPAR